jgi:hypothetical protein
MKALSIKALDEKILPRIMMIFKELCGLVEKADEEFETFLGIAGDNPRWTALRGVTLVWTGRCDEARAILEELTERVVSENSNALWRHYLPNAFLPGISSLSS